MYFLIFASDHDAGRADHGTLLLQIRFLFDEQLGQGSLFLRERAPRRFRLALASA